MTRRDTEMPDGEHRAESPGPIVWDRDEMMERMGGDETLGRAIIEAFLEDAARFLDPFEAALDSGDLKHVSNLAHSAKGIAGTVCAGELMRLAIQVEESSRGGDQATTEGYRRAWRGAVERLRLAMKSDPLVSEG
jgi:HPt (histidine-containing phosphotransfer) domain-containing protein